MSSRTTARGLDPALVYAFLGSGWSVASGVLLLGLVTWRLSPAEQGYYFTFSTLLLLQQLLEMGFGVVLMQFASHEWASLTVDSRGQASGPPRSLSRLRSLVRLGLFWYAGVAALYLVLVGSAGTVFFSLSSDGGVRWFAPWALLCSVGAVGVMTVPLSSLVEGSGRVDRNQRALLASGLIATTVASASLLLGAGLYALGVLLGVRAALALPQLAHAAMPSLRLLRDHPQGEGGVDWRAEFWPQQWRILVSWSAGFVMFQSFTPTTFQLQGPVVAGQVGATLQLFHAANRVSSAWLVAVQPGFGRLGANGLFGELERLVETTVQRSSATAAIAGAGALGALAAAPVVSPALAGRFAGLLPTLLIMLALVAMQMSNVQTAAIRFQKREPFVLNAVTGAALVGLSNVGLGYAFGVQGMAAGFAATMLIVVVPWAARVYRREISRSSATLFQQTVSG